MGCGVTLLSLCISSNVRFDWGTVSIEGSEVEEQNAKMRFHTMAHDVDRTLRVCAAVLVDEADAMKFVRRWTCRCFVAIS